MEKNAAAVKTLLMECRRLPAQNLRAYVLSALSQIHVASYSPYRAGLAMMPRPCDILRMRILQNCRGVASIHDVWPCHTAPGGYSVRDTVFQGLHTVLPPPPAPNTCLRSGKVFLWPWWLQQFSKWPGGHSEARKTSSQYELGHEVNVKCFNNCFVVGAIAEVIAIENEQLNLGWGIPQPEADTVGVIKKVSMAQISI